jgi:hypothetical protein
LRKISNLHTNNPLSNNKTLMERLADIPFLNQQIQEVLISAASGL